MKEEQTYFPAVNGFQEDNGNGTAPPAYNRLLELWSESEHVPGASIGERVFHVIRRVSSSLFRSIFTTMLSVLTLTTALFLFALFIFTIETVERLLISAQSKVTLTVYVKDDAPAEDLQSLESRLAAMTEVKSVSSLSKDEALQSFRKRLGKDGGVLEGMDSRNPLPASLEVDFKEGRIAPDKIGGLRDEIERDPVVDQVHYNQSLLDRLSGALASFRWIAVVGSSFMLIITAFIIWNTIKLALFSRREELTVLKLLGATDLAISLPYVIEGFIEGLCAAFLALLLLEGCVAVAPQLMKDAAELREIFPTLRHISFNAALLILAAGAGIALLSSFFAAGSFLREHHEI